MILLSDYRVPDYLVTSVDMHIRLHPTKTHVVTTSILCPNPDRKAGLVPLHLNGDGLTLHAIRLDGQTLAESAYSVSPDSLVLHAPPQAAFSLSIETMINPTANSKLMGLYRSNGVYCTQCEADGFRRISYFQDRPDVMAVYRVRLEAELSEAPILLANGNCVEKGLIAETSRHYAIWEDPHLKPCYLFAVVGGDLGAISDSFTTSEGRKVDLGIYVEKGKESLAHYAMDALKRSMRWDETAFGRAYDLDVFNIVAVSDFNMGAMENKGLNIFNDKYVLASPETATDTDYLLIEAIIAHEYFHNWTGNRITCRDWFQLCLKEGLTVFRDQEFTSDMRSRAVKRITDVRELRSRQFAEDSGPLAHPVRPKAYREINNFYTATVYEKGAEVIRMLKLLIGDADFKAGMDLYFHRHDGDAATIEQFIACFAEASTKDLTHFSRWYDQAGTPKVTITRELHESGKGMTLHLRQQTAPTPGQSEKQPQVIPILLGFVDADSRKNTATASRPTELIILDTAEKQVHFPALDQAAVPSLLRGFSAPVTLDLDLKDDEWLTLASGDVDAFNRWQALQTLATRLLQRSTSAVQQGQSPLMHAGLANAWLRNLQAALDDPAFAALTLTLPGEQDIARTLGVDVDPDAIHKARQGLKNAVCLALAAPAKSLYKKLATKMPYSPDAQSSGKRALRNILLDLLVTAKPAVGAALAMDQFNTADNMTDTFAALATLVQNNTHHRDAALTQFEQRYQANPLVMDKWFALQAAIPDATTIKRVQRLMSHPAFNLTNPNRARALIGGFAMSNPTQFNRADGAGYDFVAQTALQIDAGNPQVAARIMTAFRSWRTMEPIRRRKAEAALQSMTTGQKLSRDLSDIVDRTLT